MLKFEIDEKAGGDKRKGSDQKGHDDVQPTTWQAVKIFTDTSPLILYIVVA